MKKREDKVILVKNKITGAFGNVQYPGDDNLVKGPDFIERQEISNWFRGKHWKDLTWAALVPRWIDILGFFSPKGFQFYLPAYMIASVEFYDKADLLPDATISALTPPCKEKHEIIRRFSMEQVKKYPTIAGPEQLRPFSEQKDAKRIKWFSERIKGFTSEQKKAIVSFLVFMKENHSEDFRHNEIDIALKYWCEN